MKTKEELNALKEEVEALNKKLAELSDEELQQVAGGAASPGLVTPSLMPSPLMPTPFGGLPLSEVRLNSQFVNHQYNALYNERNERYHFAVIPCFQTPFGNNTSNVKALIIRLIF